MQLRNDILRCRAALVGGLLGLSLLLGASIFAAPALSVPQNVTLKVDSPSRVARGDAFEVTASIDSPMTQMDIVWMGKSRSVPAFTTSSAGGRAYASMLLPIPVDTQENELTLTVKAGGLKPVSVTISLYDKDRPVQKLKVDKKYTSPPASEKERIAEDRRRVGEAVSRYSPQKMWTLPLLRPVQGSISSQFGLKRVYNGMTKSIHRGLDLRSPMGTPVLAAADGEVVLADALYYSGNAVYIDHGLGVVTSYMHMSELNVQPGQSVQRGDIIGKVGSTGQSTGPHLHLGLMVLGTAVDSVPFLPAAATPTK